MAAITLLGLALPLQGVPAPGAVGPLILLATAAGTMVARRRGADGGAVERVLRGAAISVLVAWLVLVVLVAVGTQAGITG
ncbi:MAG: hypothetical protein ACR2NB_07635 [Solirubrobacteraceae bacterium]